jgi:ribosomal protein S18 acetylase RimI-like enzyme
MEDFIIREAAINDIPFIAEAIIEAEKSGSKILSYTTIFGLSEYETKRALIEILNEEIDGCEFSVSSFILAEKDNTAVAGAGAWIEGLEGISSNDLKRNAINYFFPKESFERARAASSAVKDLFIPRTRGMTQIEIVYVKPEFRGNNLAARLIEKQVERCSMLKNTLNRQDVTEVQVFADNMAAIKLYERLGFSLFLEKKSKDENAGFYFPSDTKYLFHRIEER